MLENSAILISLINDCRTREPRYFHFLASCLDDITCTHDDDDVDDDSDNNREDMSSRNKESL